MSNTEREAIIDEIKKWVTTDSLQHTEADIAYWNVIKYLQRQPEFPAQSQQGLRWVDIGERLPNDGEEVFWDGGENPPAWGKYYKKTRGVTTLDSSGEEYYEPIENYTRWLDEQPLPEQDELWKNVVDMCFSEVKTWYGLMNELKQTYTIIKK